jgi:two-component system sensor kinase FixL
MAPKSPETLRIADELIESLERYRAILDTAVDGIITISEQGIIETFNRAAEKMFGYAEADVVGCNISMLMPSPFRDEHDDYLRRYVATSEAKIIGIGREVVGLRKDGTTFPMDLAVGQVLLPNRRLFTGITRDISDRKQEQTENQQRLKELAHVSRLVSVGDLASGLAHEVNQPLTAVITHAQACLRMLNSGDADTPLIVESLQQIARQGERAADIVRRLRRFMLKGDAEYKSGDLNTTVRETLALVSHEISHAKVRVTLELDEQMPKAWFDQIQIEQVLVNLVRNAIEAMETTADDRRRLHIRTWTCNESPLRVGVEVLDSGIGFPEGQEQTLFQSYFTTKPQGLGQGLSICRSIVQSHRGRIWAERNSGSGAAFLFEIPIDPAPGL